MHEKLASLEVAIGRALRHTGRSAGSRRSKIKV
jgi:hypothetical protein